MLVTIMTGTWTESEGLGVIVAVPHHPSRSGDECLPKVDLVA